MALRTLLKKNARNKHIKNASKPSWYQGFGVLLLTLSFVSGLAFSYSYFFANNNPAVNRSQAEGGNDQDSFCDLFPSDPSCNPPTPGEGGNDQDEFCDLFPSDPACQTIPTPEPDPSPTPTPPPQEPKVRISKECIVEGRDCASAPVIRGASVKYIIAVTSFGNVAADQVRVADDYPETQVSSIRAFSIPTLDTGSRLAWDFGTVPSGTKKFMSYIATVTGNPGDTVTNTATVTAARDTSSGDDTASTSFRILGPTNVTIEKSCIVVTDSNRACNAAPVATGASVRYTLAIRNTGNELAKSVRVTDDYPETQVGSLRDFSIPTLDTGSRLAWEFGDMAAGASRQFSYTATVTVPGPASVTNVANVYAFNDSNNADNRAEYTFQVANPVQPVADVSITKTCVVDGRACNAAPVENGKRVEYTLTVAATGTTASNNVRVIDDYDQNLLRDLADFNPGSTNDGNRLAWDLGNLAQGQSRTLKYSAVVNSPNAASIKNVAVVSADNDSNANNNRAEYTFTTPEPARPSLALEKVCRVGAAAASALCDKVLPGSTVYYTLNVRNTGNVALANTFVEDTFNDTQLSYVAGSVQGTGILESRAGYTRFGDFNLGVNETKTINYAMRVAQGLTNGTVVENTAIAKSGSVVSNEAKARFTVEVPVTPGTPALRIDHLCLPVAQNANGTTVATTAYLEDCGDFKPGDTIFYLVRVTNTGTAVANGLSVALPAVQPPYIENVSFTFPQTRATLEVGGVWEFRYSAKVKTDVPLLATIDVNSTATIVYTNPGLGNNTSDTAIFHIKQTVPEKAIALEKFCFVVGTTKPCNAADSTLKAGDTVTYVLRVTNSGKVDITVNNLVDTYDPKITAITNLVPAGTWDAKAGTVTWTNLGVFRPSASKEYKFDAKLGPTAVAGSTVKNTARVTAQDNLSATASYEFRIPTPGTATPPPTPRTGATDTLLIFVFVLSLTTGAYFFFNSGKVAQAFGGSKGKF